MKILSGGPKEYRDKGTTGELAKPEAAGKEK